MSWSPQGVLALAALEAARRGTGELDAWRRDGVLPECALPEPVPRPLDRGTGARTGER